MKLLIWFLAGMAVMLVSVPLWADEKYERRSNPNVTVNSNNQTTRTDDHSIDNASDADSASSSQAAAEAAGGAGGGGGASDVSVSNKSSSIVLSGAQDSADCFTKIGIGAEGFGIFWSRSDAFCKKVRLIAGQLDRGNLAAAARLECTLPEWQEVYGHRKPRNKDGTTTDGYQQCLDDLDMTEPTPEGVTMTTYEYDELVAQAASAEQVEEYTEQSEYRYAQQQTEIQYLQEEHADDEAEIKRLEKKVNDEVADADARRAAVRAKIAAKEEDADGSESDNK